MKCLFHPESIFRNFFPRKITFRIIIMSIFPWKKIVQQIYYWVQYFCTFFHGIFFGDFNAKFLKKFPGKYVLCLFNLSMLPKKDIQKFCNLILAFKNYFRNLYHVCMYVRKKYKETCCFNHFSLLGSIS
jgi:hypothetical protein